MHTLYGAYKYCDEQIAKVYSEDWNVASVGIRPGVVYGVGRDQGLTSKTTFAILAAAAGKPYEVPFSGGVSWLYAGEVASAFIHAVSRERKGAPVFDMNGVYAPVEEGLSILRQLAPSAAITSTGQPLAFPMHLPDEPLRAQLGNYGNMPLAEGIRETYEAFRSPACSQGKGCASQRPRATRRSSGRSRRRPAPSRSPATRPIRCRSRRCSPRSKPNGACPSSWSTTRATACAGPSSDSTRKRSSARSG